MRCLALEKVWAAEKVRFEFQEPGKYNIFRTDIDGEEALEGCVTYSKENEFYFLTWEYIALVHAEDSALPDLLIRWCNHQTCTHQYAFYLDENNVLRSRFCSPIPEDPEAAEQICKLHWKSFEWQSILTLLLINGEFDKPEPFSLKPLTEHDKAMMKKKREKYFKVIPMPTAEENISDICQQLHSELDALKTALESKTADPAEVEPKIREIEELLKMFEQ